MFDPQKHFIKLPHKVKDPRTGNFTTKLDDYLEVKWRLVWFRERYPHGALSTEAVLLDWEKGVAIYKATACDGEGGIGMGTGTETRVGYKDFVEKAETRAIGRALAALGIGTQFVGEELSEGDHIADAPVGKSASLPSGEGEGSQDPADTHPTREQVNVLYELAISASSLEAFGRYCKTLLGLEPQAKITRKFLVAHMTGAQYIEACDYHQRLIKEAVEEDVADFVPPETSGSTKSTDPVEQDRVTDDRAARGQADLLGDNPKASAEEVAGVWRYANAHGLQEMFDANLSHWPDGISLNALLGLKRNLEWRVKRAALQSNAGTMT